MSDREITIKLPEELVERAQEVGLHLEEQSESFIAMVEGEIKRREAVPTGSRSRHDG